MGFDELAHRVLDGVEQWIDLASHPLGVCDLFIRKRARWHLEVLELHHPQAGALSPRTRGCARGRGWPGSSLLLMHAAVVFAYAAHELLGQVLGDIDVCPVGYYVGRNVRRHRNQLDQPLATLANGSVADALLLTESGHHGTIRFHHVPIYLGHLGRALRLV